MWLLESTIIILHDADRVRLMDCYKNTVLTLTSMLYPQTSSGGRELEVGWIHIVSHSSSTIFPPAIAPKSHCMPDEGMLLFESGNGTMLAVHQGASCLHSGVSAGREAGYGQSKEVNTK